MTLETGKAHNDVIPSGARAQRPRRRGIAIIPLVFAIAASLAVSACSDILDVHVPGRVQEEALDDPALAPTMVASVVSDFECAWNNYVAAAALIGDEFIQASGNLNQRNWASRRVTADEPTMAQGSCSRGKSRMGIACREANERRCLTALEEPLYATTSRSRMAPRCLGAVRGLASPNAAVMATSLCPSAGHRNR